MKPDAPDANQCLFYFHNEFDDVDVGLDNESYDGSGPFSVVITHNERAVDAAEANERYEFTRLAPAIELFLQRVRNEIDAVLDDTRAGRAHAGLPQGNAVLK